MPSRFPDEHAWSLAVEEQFYLLWPAVLLLLLARRTRLTLVAGAFWCVGAAAFAVGDRTLGAGRRQHLPPHRHLASLAAGVGAAFLLRQAAPRPADPVIGPEGPGLVRRWCGSIRAGLSAGSPPWSPCA